MRIFILLFCTTVFGFSPREVLSQNREITISGDRNYSVDEVFDLINQQTEYSFIYRSDLFAGFPKIFLRKGNINANKLLGMVIKKKDFNIILTSNNTIIIREKSQFNRVQEGVSGTVTDDEGLPVPGVTVRIKGTSSGTFTDMDGNYTIAVPNRENVLVFTAMGFESQEITVRDKSVIDITLVTKVDMLDGVTINAGYYSTSERMRTGNISRITSEELSQSPVVNPVAALSGRIPGMLITQNNGNPGSGFDIEIRGRTQIDKLNGASDEPLIIVDNVPIASGGEFLDNIGSAISANSTSGLSPLYNINMADIESIEVLKDADATAIYGSRGANGVVLITTKKGKSGTLKFDANISSGASMAPLPDMLSTKQYVAMRKEALGNDGLDLYELANSSRASDRNQVYDLAQYDTLRDHNLVKQLIGGTAYTHDAQLSLSGGSELIQFRLGGNYHRETNVFPGDFPNTRVSSFVNISTKSRDEKFSGSFSASYTATRNTSPSSDLTASISLPPNYKLYEENGDLAWNEGGYDSDNPLSYIYRKYEAKTRTLNANAFITYTPIKNLILKSSIGYNLITTEDDKIWPSTAFNPLDRTGADGLYYLGNSEFKSWIWEPQVEYTLKLGKGVLNTLIGGSLQSNEQNRYSLTIKGYENDRLIGSLSPVTPDMFMNPSSSFSQYRYGAFFGRVNYAHDNKYIINLSGRRDGSSRFGPDFRFSSFGAIGAAWIISDEHFMQNLTAVSFAKFRGSYGVTGNDKIGNYKFQDVYATQNGFSGPGSYDGEVALIPESLFKPTLHWEKNIKLEFAMDVNFFMDRLRLSAAWYRNNSSDPLVNYPLPLITGYANVVANLEDVLVQNRGWELMLSSTNISNGNFRWTTNFNITIPKNELKKFPGLESSSYSSDFIIGKSLNTVISGHVVGVDPETGLYRMKDYNGNGTYEPAYDKGGGDFRPLLDTDPNFYGGLRNTFSYKGFNLDIFFQFRKKKGFSWLSSYASSLTQPIGYVGKNYPSVVLNRWQNPGDTNPIQKYTTTASFLDLYDLNGGHAPSVFSSMMYTDVSFIRLKNVALSYQFKKKVLNHLGLSSLSVYAQGHNLLTITSYNAGDPETATLRSLPPLRTVVMGIQLSL
ncbi:SusC/RagA family TonB-linked outer membrane protein [Sinomicrobium soli]|uniref:SusC/RagA family TonB-linked outer membrane protein n=1 Tax=Sinomicrobium sp. N-1-3-6 TaxID=2219864 RepID=UPI001374DD0A|nr:SusC/RagA family TonB-linked outer membrane protein [Sinomicrobium sp. N-1-3-6]